MERGPEELYRQHSQVHRQSDVLDGNQYQALFVETLICMQNFTMQIILVK